MGEIGDLMVDCFNFLETVGTAPTKISRGSLLRANKLMRSLVKLMDWHIQKIDHGGVSSSET